MRGPYFFPCLIFFSWLYIFFPGPCLGPVNTRPRSLNPRWRLVNPRAPPAPCEPPPAPCLFRVQIRVNLGCISVSTLGFRAAPLVYLGCDPCLFRVQIRVNLGCISVSTLGFRAAPLVYLGCDGYHLHGGRDFRLASQGAGGDSKRGGGDSQSAGAVFKGLSQGRLEPYFFYGLIFFLLYIFFLAPAGGRQRRGPGKI